MMKQFTGIIITALLMFALLPAPASAASYTEAVTPKYDKIGAFFEGFAVVTIGEKFGFVDKTGKELVPLEYDYASSFSEGLAVVELNGKCGCIDTRGNVVIPFEFEYINQFSEGLASVYLNEKCGFIDKTGKLVIPYTYDNDLNGFNDGLAAVEKNGKWGFIDKTGKEITPFKYDEVRDFNEGMAAVCVYGESDDEDICGFVNTDGDEIIRLEYDFVRDFSEGLAAVALVDVDLEAPKVNFGFVDKSGKVVVEPSLVEVTDFSGGIALGVEISYTDYTATAVYGISPTGQKSKLDIDPSRIGISYAGSNNGTFIFTPDGEGESFIAVDKTGKILAEYPYIGFFDNGWAVALRLAYDTSSGDTYLLPGFLDADYTYTYLPYEDVSVLTREGMLGVYENGKWGFVALSSAAPALPSTQNLSVNGKSADPDRYNIGGNNYFKLRDLAYLLNGTECQFELGYENGTIIVTTGKPYTANGTEMSGKGTSNKQASLSGDKIMLNGKLIELTAYKIDGSNYFKLRDVGDAIGFGVDYDEAARTIVVTAK